MPFEPARPQLSCAQSPVRFRGQAFGMHRTMIQLVVLVVVVMSCKRICPGPEVMSHSVDSDDSYMLTGIVDEASDVDLAVAAAYAWPAVRFAVVVKQCPHHRCTANQSNASNSRDFMAGTMVCRHSPTLQLQHSEANVGRLGCWDGSCRTARPGCG